MTTPITAIKSMCGLLRGGNVTYPVPQEAAAMIEALTAERDAAVAKAATLSEAERFASLSTLEQANVYREAGIAEGERRATAAIVADLRKEHTLFHIDRAALVCLSNRYERGDHITEAKPADMSATKAP